MKIERPLDEIEIRVLGSLLEKQQSTPDVYPLSLNALRTACNQSTSREPVMNLSEEQLRGAIETLQEIGLVWRVHGSRAEKFEHNLDRQWGLDAPARAVMTLLLLRGPQTPGELRARSERLHPFASVAEVEDVLAREAATEEPLVRELERLPGQKESRWAHLAGSAEPVSAPADAPRTAAVSLTARVETLEESVRMLGERLAALEKALGE